MKISTQVDFRSLNAKKIVLNVFLLLSSFYPESWFGQTRVYVNPGVEFGVAANQNKIIDTNFGFGATFDAGVAATSPWYTSHPTAGNCAVGFVGICHPIEAWGTGFGSVTAAEGTGFVELNASASSMIYQNLYLVNGDIINFSFKHRARVLTAEQAAMVIENQSQVNIATMYSTIVPSSTTAWSDNVGTHTFTGTTGVYRVGYRSLVNGGNPGTGNLLDALAVTLNPLIDLKFTNALSSCEGLSNGNLFMRINGAVKANTTIAFQLIDPVNGTALATDSDITVTGVANSNGTPVVTHTAGSSIYLVTIPLGNYDGGVTIGYSNPTSDEDGIALNIVSANDLLIYEPTETFKFEIKTQGTNGSTNNFVSTTSPIFGDTYVPSTTAYFIQQCICYNNANTGAAGFDTKVGISVLQKVSPNNSNWPLSRKSGHIVLESNNKGFVISRLTTVQINNLTSPQEGMMVYDTSVKCLKLYDGTSWSCFSTAACP
jgi:hypothetical protein